LGPASQVELGDLKKLVYIEVSHFSSHAEPFRPITNVFMVPSPKQLVHPLGTSHLSEFQQQQNQDATLLTTHRPSKHKNKIDQPLGSSSDSNS